MASELRNSVIEAHALTGSATANVVLISRLDLSTSDYKLRFVLRRRRFSALPEFGINTRIIIILNVPYNSIL